MTAIPFCGQAYTDRTLNANAQEAVNLYPMISPASGIQGQRIVMYPTPGYNEIYDVVGDSGITGAGAIRSMFVINDDLYAVSGSRFIRITSSGGAYTAISLGTLSTSTGRCTIVSNTVEIAISDGTNGYIYDLSAKTFTTISGGSWPSSGGVTNFAFIDGYTLASLNNSSRVIQSDLLAAGTYGAQAFVDVSSYPDNNVAVFSDQLQLYIFGPRLTEVRFNAARVPFAFEKVQGALIQAGCAALHSIVKVGGSIIWLASDVAGKAYVAALEGYSTRPLSTAPINEAMERYSRVDDAFAFSYREGDTQFYCLTFPTADVTWVMDIGTGLWHQRSVNNGRDLPDHCELWQDIHVVGDSSGKLYRMSQEFTKDGDGNGLRRVRSTQHFDAEGRVIILDEIAIDMETGTAGGNAGDVYPGSPALEEATATLFVSKDGGHTWVDVGSRSFGAQGQLKKRLIWRRLGYSRNGWTFRLQITDTVRTYIIGASARFRTGK